MKGDRISKPNGSVLDLTKTYIPPVWFKRSNQFQDIQSYRTVFFVFVLARLHYVTKIKPLQLWTGIKPEDDLN